VFLPLPEGEGSGEGEEYVQHTKCADLIAIFVVNDAVLVGSNRK